MTGFNRKLAVSASTAKIKLLKAFKFDCLNAIFTTFMYPIRDVSKIYSESKLGRTQTSRMVWKFDKASQQNRKLEIFSKLKTFCFEAQQEMN